jgi:hypothetical protein
VQLVELTLANDRSFPVREREKEKKGEGEGGGERRRKRRKEAGSWGAARGYCCMQYAVSAFGFLMIRRGFARNRFVPALLNLLAVLRGGIRKLAGIVGRAQIN